MSICSEDIKPIDLNVNIMNVFKESESKNTFSLKIQEKSNIFRPNISMLSIRKRELQIRNGDIDINIIL